jgi:hypothetical protein
MLIKGNFAARVKMFSVVISPCKNWRKDTKNTFSYMLEIDYVVLEAKSIGVR